MKLNSEMKSLQDAGIGRQLADWTIGINLLQLQLYVTEQVKKDYQYWKSITSNIKNYI